MHARIDQLLSACDGEPLDALVAQHVSECARCSAELVRLQTQRDSLRRLPELRAPDVWSRVSNEVVQRRSARPFGSWAAIAASGVLAAVLVSGYQLREGSSSMGQQAVPAKNPEPQISNAQLARLIERSRALENTLHQLPQRRTVERASTAVTIDGLEKRIQWLDYYLSYSGDEGLDELQASRLWQERVELMDTLVKVRYANTHPY